MSCVMFCGVCAFFFLNFYRCCVHVCKRPVCFSTDSFCGWGGGRYGVYECVTVIAIILLLLLFFCALVRLK